jgi:signal transduction histidine kinase
MDKQSPEMVRAAELEVALVARDALLGQMRDVNERLVLASLRADELVEIADAAHLAAAYNERRFRALAATTAAVIWRADPSGEIHIEQDSWGAFDHLADEATVTDDDLRWRWLRSIPLADRARVRETWTRAFTAGTPYVCQHRLKVRDGEVWVTARAVPVIVDDLLREWIGRMTDITARVRIEEAKEQFIAILGHDLRNPLTAISLGAESFRGLPDPHGRIAAQISRSAHRMEAMIRDMMDFTRGRLGGGIPVTKGPCNLGVLAHEVVAEMRTAHPARDLRCETIGDLDGMYDTDRAEQVLSNLLGNAVAHGRGPIQLTVRAQEDDVVITVHNQGTPIPAALLPTLFEPFLRGPQMISDRRANQGLGLGLYIVSEIVHAHGGSVAITSTLEAGTTVTVRWPRG